MFVHRGTKLTRRGVCDGAYATGPVDMSVALVRRDDFLPPFLGKLESDVEVRVVFSCLRKYVLAKKLRELEPELELELNHLCLSIISHTYLVLT